MTGRRKAKGQAVRRVESWNRSLTVHARRTRTVAGSPSRKVRAHADLLCAGLRRVEPHLAAAAADRAVSALTAITRHLEEEIRR